MRRLAFIVLAGLTAFLLAYGATYNGMLNPPARIATLGLLGLAAGAALLVTWRAGRSFTLFDASLIVWAAALAVSTLANADDFRRISIGLWFTGAYALALHLLAGLQTGGALKRTQVLDALLLGGLATLLFGGAQLSLGLQGAAPALVRPVGTLGNPNSFAGVLVLLLPAAIVRLMTVRAPLGRVLLAVYAVLGLALLAATFSRGGWIGGAAGLAALALLLAGRRGLLSRDGLARWWAGRTARVRLLAGGAAVLAVLALAVGVIAFAGTFSLGGRTLNLRTFIYQSAIAQFAERPLTGHGLFAFGAGLARLNPTPPTEPHSHAHNLPLNVAAELGLPGLLALGCSAVAILLLARRALRASSGRDFMLLAGACAGVVAFAVHHLTDLPAMNPAVMAALLLPLSMLIAPPRDAARQGRVRAVTGIIGAAGLAVLLLTAIPASLTYNAAYAVLADGLRARDYAGAAAALAPVIAQDAAFAPYFHQQGMLYAVAAAQGNVNMLAGAEAAFARYTQLAPDYTFGWANLAGVRAALGDVSGAAEALRPLQALAPDMLMRWRDSGLAWRAFDPQNPIAADDEYLPNIHTVQWLMLGIPRVFAPQASLPLPDAVWAALGPSES